MKNTKANLQQAGYPKLSKSASSRSQIPTAMSVLSSVAAGSLHLGSVIDNQNTYPEDISTSLNLAKASLGLANMFNGGQAIIANNSPGNLPKSPAEYLNQNIASFSNFASGGVLLAEAFNGKDLTVINNQITNAVKVVVSSTQMISNVNQGLFELKRQNQTKMKK